MGEKPLWRCPKCGHDFVTRNMSHSCVQVGIDDHFKDKDPAIRELFDRLRALIEECGPVTVYAQKTRIVFQVRARFAGATPHKKWLDCGFWLKRRASHSLIRRVGLIPPRDHVHLVRLTRWEGVDERFKELIAEAYRVGCQKAEDQAGFTAPAPSSSSPPASQRSRP